MRVGDWFDISAIPSIGFGLYGVAFGLFKGSAMSPLANCFWIMGAIVLAGLNWLSAARGQQKVRESKKDQQEAEARLNARFDARFDEIKQLMILKPDATRADVARVVDGMSARAVARAGTIGIQDR